MKIAIASNDRKNIAKRTGRAAEYAIYTIENGEITNVQYEENQHHHDDEHDRSEGNHRQVSGFGHGEGRNSGRGLGQGRGHGKGLGKHQNHTHEHHHHEEEAHSHNEVVEQLKNIDMFLVRAVGKYLRQDLINGNIPFQLVKGEKLDDIVQDYLKSLQN